MHLAHEQGFFHNLRLDFQLMHGFNRTLVFVDDIASLLLYDFG
jgi:hypothetical protein